MINKKVDIIKNCVKLIVKINILMNLYNTIIINDEFLFIIFYIFYYQLYSYKQHLIYYLYISVCMYTVIN